MAGACLKWLARQENHVMNANPETEGTCGWQNFSRDGSKMKWLANGWVMASHS
jgi:hypothetical protein